MCNSLPSVLLGPVTTYLLLLYLALVQTLGLGDRLFSLSSPNICFQKFQTREKKMRVAVIGGGISGLVAASELAKAGVEVVLYEKEDNLGAHSKTATFNGIDLDLSSMLFNPVTEPSTMQYLENLGFDLEPLDMSFSVSLDQGRGYEWGTRNGLRSLFSQKTNLINPYFLQLFREITKFKDDAVKYLEELQNNPDIHENETLGQFIKKRGYSELFEKAYLVPICASIWSCSSEAALSFSSIFVLSYCHTHHLLQLFDSSQWLSLGQRAHDFFYKVEEQLRSKGCQIKTGHEVESISTDVEGCTVICQDGSKETYDRCIIAAHAPDALKMLGNKATYDELQILGAFQYVQRDIFFHHDKSLMPKNPMSWSARNFLCSSENKVCLTYWLNVLQNVGDTTLPFLVTLDPAYTPENTLLKWSTRWSIPSVAAFKASSRIDSIQGKRGIWFCGAYQGHGFQEDRFKAGIVAADGILGTNSTVQKIPKHMEASLFETWARLLVIRFFKSYISTGCLIIYEEGGAVFTFGGTSKKSYLKSAFRVHNPQFYWKVATEAELGLADAYIHGDISFVNKDEGLLNLLMIFIVNNDLNSSVSRSNNKRGWWSLLRFTAGLALGRNVIQHILNQNTVTQARRNISRHYDLSNDLFATFLDETMTYSCAVFKREDEDLKAAQLRKITALIEKARIEKRHEILDIGCGWGSLAIEVVKQTGCKYTGITLSEQQFKFAEKRVKEAGLQDYIKLLHCDYRQVPDTCKYDRIISCGMIEHVGHEYIEEFFSRCESLLAKDGLLVLQFISAPDHLYDEYRRGAGFIKEYIFPGGCVPSLCKITSSMASASRLCVEHIENIGIHYYQTLRCWRKNFLGNRSKVLTLGFDEKFIRTWEYYFDYCAAGFKTRTLGDYQIVFSRPGNNATFDDPYEGFPSAYSTHLPDDKQGMK